MTVSLHFCYFKNNILLLSCSSEGESIKNCYFFCFLTLLCYFINISFFCFGTHYTLFEKKMFVFLDDVNDVMMTSPAKKMLIFFGILQ